MYRNLIVFKSIILEFVSFLPFDEDGQTKVRTLLFFVGHTDPLNKSHVV